MVDHKNKYIVSTDTTRKKGGAAEVKEDISDYEYSIRKQSIKRIFFLQ